MKKVQKFKKVLFSVLTFSFLINLNIPANSTEKEVKVYSGRHYNTDRGVYKKFSEELAGIFTLNKKLNVKNENRTFLNFCTFFK